MEKVGGVLKGRIITSDFSRHVAGVLLPLTSFADHVLRLAAVYEKGSPSRRAHGTGDSICLSVEGEWDSSLRRPLNILDSYYNARYILIFRQKDVPRICLRDDKSEGWHPSQSVQLRIETTSYFPPDPPFSAARRRLGVDRIPNMRPGMTA